MDDKELQALREARLRDLKGKNAGARDEKDDMRAAMLPQLLTQDARERLNRIRIVKPDRASQAEQLIISMAQTGQIQQRVDEPSLVKLLDQLTQHQEPTNRLKFSRRESDSEEDELEQPTNQANEDSDDDFFD